MSRRLLLLYMAMVAGLVFPACSARAGIPVPGDGEVRFFSSIQDMPLMPGLTELSDQMVVFDKPEGRIVESLAVAETGSADDIENYYEEVLPQFGWNRIARNSFIRGEERLNLAFETREGRQLVRLTLTPKKP